MATYKTPDVYVEEISTLAASVAEVSTAIPAFIGYTEKSSATGQAPQIERISTFVEYKDLFGGPSETKFSATVNNDGSLDNISIPAGNEPKYFMYYCLDLYFKNGGGSCYIVSVGTYEEDGSIDSGQFSNGLTALEKEDEPTIILFTEAVNLAPNAPDEYYALCNDVLAQCQKLGDRFGIFDVLDTDTDASDFRNNIRSETEYLKYGAAYTPYLLTSIAHAYSDSEVKVEGNRLGGYQTDENGINVVHIGINPATYQITITLGVNINITFAASSSLLTINLPPGGSFPNDIKTAWDEWKKGKDAHEFEISVAGDGSVKVDSEVTSENTSRDKVTLQGLETAHTSAYNNVRQALDKERMTLPPAAAIAGVYATTDRDRGVWKAPANVSIVSINGPTRNITSEEQENLNVDTIAGKSINAIREFTGKGTLVWGARTLAGNDNEWRYVSVRRLFNTIEESCRESTAYAVFEPNDSNTWLKVKSTIDGYLYGLWQDGALSGSTAQEAYFINVGLGSTMTSQDILEGRMIVEVGIAAVRPAEFIILQFSHLVQES